MPPILVFNAFPRPYSPIIRQVKPNEGESLAKVNKSAWVETSAKNDVNVGECDFGSYDPAVSHRLSYCKARYLSYAWLKSKSGRPPAAMKHQRRTNASLCDTIMSLHAHQYSPFSFFFLAPPQAEPHRLFTSYLPLLLLHCFRAGRIDVLSLYISLVIASGLDSATLFPNRSIFFLCPYIMYSL
jgi:hypothetical protein